MPKHYDNPIDDIIIISLILGDHEKHFVGGVQEG
jgi:hypothetical protein